MNKPAIIRKRDFIQHTSRYLKLAEAEGKIIITHHNKPTLEVKMLKPKSIRELKGLIKEIDDQNDITDQELLGYDEW